MKDFTSSFEKKIKILYTEEQRQKIYSALAWAGKLHAGQKRATGEPFLVHPVKVAEFLCDLRMDYETIIAGLLHDVIEDTPTTKEEVCEKFGETIANLVEGVTKISSVTPQNHLVQSSQTIRKMLFAMTEDIRVILVKLADRYHNMLTMDVMPPEKQQQKAKECLEIYAPLAERLGMSWMKAELEDISLKYINYTAWNHIVENFQLRERKREEFLKKVTQQLQHQGEKEGLKFQIQSRAKHIYSIYTKMKKQKKDLDEMFDLMGVRLICSTINECYSLLGMVHSLWPPIEGRFKDYIAMPKANLYQSLHTTVMCFDGQLLEIQIRTQQMHAQAEFGIAAHWTYKNETNRIPLHPDELMIINKLKGWNNKDKNDHDFLKEIKEELLRDSIYIFTPTGQLIELPKGSTPLDFAYHIHTEVGNHYIGARNQNGMIPINASLQNTDVVEILTSENAHPHKSWLRIVRTSRARSKIRYWLLRNDEEMKLFQTISQKNREARAARDGKAQEPIKSKSQKKNLHSAFAQPQLQTGEMHYCDSSHLKILVGKEQNIMIKMAGCCHPAPGDPIVGYVSRGRGIIIHLQNCNNLAHIADLNERIIHVEWDDHIRKESFHLSILSKKIPDLFARVDSAVRKLNGHLIQGRVEEIANGNLSGNFLLAMESENDLVKVKRSIKNIPSILSITETKGMD